MSWATSIFGILTFGYLFIERLDSIEFFAKIPLHWTVAGLIGSVAELYVPNLVKKIFRVA